MVGVIRNLSLWFALHVVFATVFLYDGGPFRVTLPEITSLRWDAVILIALAAWLLLRRHLGIGWGLLFCAGAALALGAIA